MDEVKPNGKLTQINEARKKKKSKGEGIPKLKTGEIYRALADVIKRVPYTMLPPFPKRYEVIEPELGARLPLLVADDESVTLARLGALANDILAYCETSLAGRPDFALTPRQARDAAEYYLMTGAPIPPEEVKAVRWLDEPGLTYRRMPWVRQRGSAPTWEGLIGRMSNAEAVLAWLGSLFYEESSLHSYVWLYGVGGDGKGSINRFLSKVFGTSYRSKQPPGNGQFADKFWTYGLLGARLVVLPDCDDFTFVSKGLFKSLTGGDPVDLQAKGQMSFTARLNAKYLIISNEKPSVSSEKADMRRIIYSELRTAEAFDPDFEAKLWEEGGAFLSACVDRYVDGYPNHGPIQSDGEEIAEWVATLEEPFEVVLHRWLRLDENAHIVPGDMQRMLKAEWPKSRRDQLDFMRWLEKTHGIRRKRVPLPGGCRQWQYGGAELINFTPDFSADWR